MKVHKVNLESGIEYLPDSYPHEGFFENTNTKSIFFVTKKEYKGKTKAEVWSPMATFMMPSYVWYAVMKDKDLFEIEEKLKEQPILFVPKEEPMIRENFALKIIALINGGASYKDLK